MKKILFLFLVTVLIAFATDKLFCQQKIPVTKQQIQFAGSNLSSPFTIGKNEFVSGIFVPAGVTTKLFFEVYESDSLGYCFMQDGAGARYSITLDSTVASYVALPPTKFLSAKKMRITIYKATGRYMFLEKRPY